MTLVTLINTHLDTLIPLIFELKEEISQHILIYDIADKKYATRLKRGIKNLQKLYSIQSDIELIGLDEDDIKDINKLQSLLNRYKDIALNISNSDFALSERVSCIIKELQGKIYAYDKEDNSYNILPGFSNHKISNNMKIEDFCALMDINIVETIDKESIRKDKNLLQSIFNKPSDLFRYMDLLQDGYIQEASKLYPKLHKILHQRFDQIKNRSEINKLFEEYLFLYFDKFDFDDLECGIKLDFYPSQPNTILNEFDLLFIKDNHIGFVEIKLSKTSQNYLPIIYKNDAIMDFFGHDTLSIIYNLINESSTISLSLQKRANIKNIILIQENQVTFETIKKALFNYHIYPRHFLLGGYDLEMVTIKKLLDRCGQIYSDYKLSWGAKLSSYKDILNDYEHFYGIELIEDIEPPKHYTPIDHHNQMQHLQSALEQVAKILNIKLNRHQMLVALNDKGYIKAMQQFGASKQEIDQIREADRRAQGVTQEEEQKAQEEIKEAKKRGDIYIIKTTLSHFSPIVDRLYPANILIYNDKTINYYGRDVKKLVEKFQSLIDQKRAYYGGNFGFFGIEGGEEMVEEILSVLDK